MISKNPYPPIEVRLEAYEDIIAPEVGDTSMVRARNFDRRHYFVVLTGRKS